MAIPPAPTDTPRKSSPSAVTSRPGSVMPEGSSCPERRSSSRRGRLLLPLVRRDYTHHDPCAYVGRLLGLMSASSRRQAIRAMIGAGGVASQSELMRRLEGAGHHVSQSTVSRDLEAIG